MRAHTQHIIVPSNQSGRLVLLSVIGGGFFATLFLWQYSTIIAVLLLGYILLYLSTRICMIVWLAQKERKPVLPPPSPARDLDPYALPEPEQAPDIDPVQEPETMFTFRDMLEADIVFPTSPFTLAYGDNYEPIQFDRLTSLGIGGFPGSGKTVTTLLILLEAVAKYNGHIRFLVVDPHMYAGDDALVPKIQALSPYFLTVQDILATVSVSDHDYHSLLKRASDLANPLEGGDGLRMWMKIVEMEMDRRKHGKKGDTWVIVMDEFVSLMHDPKVAGPVSKMIEALNQQARKMGMFSLLISQQWKASALNGSTDLRQSIPTFIVHNMPEHIACLILPSVHARQASQLEIGQVLIYHNGHVQKGHVPCATPEDADFVSEYYLPYVPPPTRLTSTFDTVPLAEPKPTGIPDEFMRSELDEIRKLYASGLAETDIAKVVYKVVSGPDLALARLEVKKQIMWLVGREL